MKNYIEKYQETKSFSKNKNITIKTFVQRSVVVKLYGNFLYKYELLLEFFTKEL